MDRRTFSLLQGILTLYAVTAANGITKRQSFCVTCGAPLVMMLDERPHIIAIAVGSLDDPGVYCPQADMSVQSAQPWDVMDPNLTTYSQGYHLPSR